MAVKFQKPYKKIYFVGIGGISMSGLAEILHDKGYQIAGSDVKESNTVTHLKELGIPIAIGQKEENITEDIDLIVYTAAVKDNNPELIAAKEKKIDIMSRAELLGLVMDAYHYSIAVSGTHGKTTTSSMISEILMAAKTDPTISIGGILPAIGGNSKVGKSDFFVAEACEYCDSFLHFYPYVAVILNVEAEHLDYFKDLEQIKSSFRKFALNVPENGFVVINSALDSIHYIKENLKCRVVTFGLDAEKAAWSAANIIHEDNGTNSFDVIYKGRTMGRVSLNIPGEHNIMNALAACAATSSLGIGFEAVIKGLGNYEGANRRFQYKGSRNGVTIVDDYAHHPTEVKATLAAATKVKHNDIWCIFQPHTFSRLKAFLDDFSNAFSDADKIIIADVYAAREKDTGEISAKDLVQKLQKNGKDAQYVGDLAEIQQYVSKHCQSGDLLITMGAGDVYLVGEKLLEA